MTPEAVAAALIAGKTPDIADMTAYWLATDAAQRPKAETVAVLAALSAAPTQADRVEAFVRYVDESYEAHQLACGPAAVNIVGTGGGASTFNISTTAAIVAAAAGGTVLKSGSSAYSSSVGSADILSALGLGRPMALPVMNAMLSETGLAFAPASAYAPICRRLAIAAQPLPFKVIGRFINALGPLICPFAVRGSVVGASSPEGYEVIRTVAHRTGRRLLAVHSELGVDELLSIGPNRIGWADGQADSRLDPATLGLAAGPLVLLSGGTLDHNVALLQDVLRGRAPQAALETVALNAGAVLHVGGRAASVEAGTALALDCLREGAPFGKLRQVQRFAQSVRRHQEAAE
ncbi:hypothetical protein [Gemmobacter caeruleus]|uniref:hypothetical protein n=1 Tax=Gemmobacter caeruleus TaxID=2595004 RepID=UPI0011EE7F56|nr:hypothetical protein [Gemmobacter caeruleus]